MTNQLYPSAAAPEAIARTASGPTTGRTTTEIAGESQGEKDPGYDDGPAIRAASPGRTRIPDPSTEVTYSATACRRPMALRRTGGGVVVSCILTVWLSEMTLGESG